MRNLLKLIAGFTVACSLYAAEDLRQPPEYVSFTPKQIAASRKIKHLIILFQENWSFDSLYGKFPGVNGLSNASEESYRQVNANGVPYRTLPPCINTNNQRPYSEIPAQLPNAPFDLQPFIPSSQKTGDLIHAFYHEMLQINDGKMNAFAAYSDAKGFVMSYYDISKTRIGKISQQYTICDNFFHSCYGGSTCNVLFLFSGQMPLWPNAAASITSKVDSKGMLIKDGLASEDGYAINDAQPFYEPHKKGTPESHRIPPQTYKTIGDLLTEKNVPWGWYAEGWNDAVRGETGEGFPYHHQAPTYFKQFAPGTKQRKEHLFDLKDFYAHLEAGTLPAVCFIRSLNKNSQHPSSGNLRMGLDWCADLIEKVQASSAWNDTAIILTYDENGGRWDHVTPPIIDEFGPATRIPAVIISPYAKKGYVDHTSYETVSILKFIEERWGLPSLSSRDAQANNLLNAFDFESPK